MFSIKLFCIGLILIVTIVAGAYPFLKKLRSADGLDFPIGEALAAGVFLGAGLIHMLADSAREFMNQGYHYPFAFLVVGIIFLILLLFEHVGREIYEHKGEHDPSFALITVMMLSVHGFLEGAALGLSQSWSVLIVVLLAILAHKWAESFALAIEINKSRLTWRSGLMWFAIFAVMTPLGIIAGSEATAHLSNMPLLVPIFSALAAGTFLYLGTLHGLKSSVMVEKCCDLSQFSFVIVGFAIMAIVALWA